MLQNFPMYAYIPAQDVRRAREFDGGVEAAWFRDTGGNIMALIQGA